MKDMYDWVPWFGELTERVAEMGGSVLIRRAARVRWKADGSLSPLMGLRDEQIDPFSFWGATTCQKRALVFDGRPRQLDLRLMRSRSGLSRVWSACQAILTDL